MEFLREEARLKRVDAQRAQLFQEFNAGIWDAAEYRKKIRKLLKPQVHQSETPPHKRRGISPDWDDQWPETSSDI
jgi:hypothetical protein